MRTDWDNPYQLTNALVTLGRPLAVETNVPVTAFSKNIVRSTSREAQCTIPYGRADCVTAESFGALAKVEAVLWCTLPCAGALATLTFISTKEVYLHVREKGNI